MNSDEVTSPSSPATSNSSRRIRVRPAKRSSISQEVALPAIPTDDNDPDWVSPFTLPPLPAFKKNRTQVDRSPEDRHARVGSSAYYAAAWGSPYATPSPNQSPAPRVTRNRSLDLEASPLAARKVPSDQSSRHSRLRSLPLEDSNEEQDPIDRSTSTDSNNSQRKSQRRNWLSESEESESEFGKLSGKTPTQSKFLDPETPSSSGRKHHIQASVDTITPETFNGASSIESKLQEAKDSTMAEPSIPSPTAVEEKPLPSLPQESSRPSLLPPSQSFSRPKRKVPWKGKSCIVALPYTDREYAGLPPVLSPEERDAILRRWTELGYPVYGFDIGAWHGASHEVGGASRPTYPDQRDIELEWKTTAANVRVPNAGEWEAWVEYLKEEKLRALGVTPSTSEAPPSTASPFSSTMSRVSSVYPGMAPTPPLPGMSAASMRQRMSHSPFSPSISISNPAFAALSQRGTPGIPNARGMHGYTQSIAIPGMGQRIGSPFDYMSAQPSSYVNNVRSPDGQIPGRGPWTPGHVQGMQSMANLMSPVNPSPHDFSRGFPANPQLQAMQIQRQQEALARQRQEVQAKIANHQRQMSMFPIRAMSTEQVHQLPHTPQAVSPEREPPEIMHPTPRSHRHNLSAALEKGVTDSVTASSKGLKNVIENSSQAQAVENILEGSEDGEIAEDKDQEDLPILHRPETLKDVDDKVEIETNPSIAGTPLLLTDQNPFANFKPLPPPSEIVAKRPGFGHAAKPSLSNFNAKAKEFSPSAPLFSPNVNAGPFNFDGNAFESQGSSTSKPQPPKPSSGVFNFDGNAFASHSPGKSVTTGPRFGHKHNPSSLGLNVAASVFTPSFTQKSAQQPSATASISSLGKTPIESVIEENPIQLEPMVEPETKGQSAVVTPAKSSFDPKSSTFSTFSFGSASFNVEAPEFKPSGLSVSSIDFTPEKLMNFSGKIFGDVSIDPATKSERRAKAVPIVRPASREGSAAPELQENVDAAGRPMAPVERNKRARTTGLDNEEISFADTAPFKALNEDKDVAVVPEDDGSVDTVVSETKDLDVQQELTTDSATNGEDNTTSLDKSVEQVVVAETETKAESQIEESTLEPEQTQEIVSVNKEQESGGETIKQSSEETPAAEVSNPEHVKEVAGDIADVTKTETEPEIAAPQEEIVEATEPAHTPVVPHVGKVDEVEQESTRPGPSGDSVEKATAITAFSANAPAFKPAFTATAPVFQPQSEVIKNETKLSAVAPAFEFKPVVKDFAPVANPTTVQPDQSAPKPKKAGLLGSRYASSVALREEEAKEIADLVAPIAPIAEEDEAPPSPEPVIEEIAKIETPQETAKENIPLKNRPTEADIISTLERFREPDSRSESVVSKTGDLSYEEINAVMQQFEDNPDLGVIRSDTPVKSTPLIDMRYPRPFRSDAPSPSPNRRLDKSFTGRGRPYEGLGFDISGVHQLNYGGEGEISDWNAELSGDLSPGQQDKLESRAHFFDDHVNDIVDNILENRLAPLEKALMNIQNSIGKVTEKSKRGRRSMSTEHQESDADDEDDYDAYEGYDHYRSRSPAKSSRRHERIKNAVLEALNVAQETTASPQVDMSTIEAAVNEMRELAQKASAQPAQAPLDLSSILASLADIKTSTEREVPAPTLDVSELARAVAEMKSLTQQRSAEPQLDVKAMYAALTEIKQLTSEKPAVPEVDLSSIEKTLLDLKASAETKAKEVPVDIRSIVEEAIASQSQLNKSSSDNEQEIAARYQSRIDDLEKRLAAAERMTQGEVNLRREAEQEIDSMQRLLRESQDQASSHKEASEEAQKSLKVFLQEKQEYKSVNNEVRDLRLKNEALEKTLDGYREYKESAAVQLEAERGQSRELSRLLHDARKQHADQTESKDVLRSQLEDLQARMTSVVQDIKHDESEWQKREHDLLSKNQLLQAALDHETNRRARLELEADKMNKEHRESLMFKARHDTAKEEITRLAVIITTLQAENKTHQDTAYKAQRELDFNQEKHAEIVESRTSRLQDELDVSKSAYDRLQAEADATIARLQGQLNNATNEIRETKAKHESNMEKMFENHNSAVRQANEKNAAELEQRLAIHEEKLIDLQSRHKRDMENAAEDRKMLEHRYVEMLQLSADNVKHLESKAQDLQERLDITRDAARAAAAAASKHINLPTPASSVVASPPHRASISSASMPIARGSDVPEKISPQALRETIMVLQDQLQNREQKIDKLESELAAIDKDAPNKVKERDTEIVMLRELLEVRVDDLQELISTLNKPDYNRAAVADAAIRLRTQIKMEQQLKERAIKNANAAANGPSSLSSLTQSPRAMIAAAAWGNWQKVRDSGVGSVVSDFANNIGSQTPSRATAGSSTALRGIMTPPATSKSPNVNTRGAPAARPLATTAATRKASGPASPSAGARPLRAFNSQPRALSGARPMGRRGTNESQQGGSGLRDPSGFKVEPPSTPLQLAVDTDFGEDVDDDASPLDGKDRGFDTEEIVSPKSPRTTKIASPRRSRTSSGKLISPRALRAAAPISTGEHVEVLEED